MYEAKLECPEGLGGGGGHRANPFCWWGGGGGGGLMDVVCNYTIWRLHLNPLLLDGFDLSHHSSIQNS